MGADYKVERREGPDGGRYIIHLAPGAEAELVYYRRGDGDMIITHTGVPSAYEGQGIAGLLVDAAVADARARGHRITPLCSYVAAQFRRHPEWHDLLA